MKMDWNNDATRFPSASGTHSGSPRTIANVQDLPTSVYPYRLFM